LTSVANDVTLGAQIHPYGSSGEAIITINTESTTLLVSRERK